MNEQTKRNARRLASAVSLLIDELSEAEVVGADEPLAANEYRGPEDDVFVLSDCTADGMTRAWRGRFGPVMPHFLALATIEGWDGSDPVRDFCLSFHRENLAQKTGVGA